MPSPTAGPLGVDLVGELAERSRNHGKRRRPTWPTGAGWSGAPSPLDDALRELSRRAGEQGPAARRREGELDPAHPALVVDRDWRGVQAGQADAKAVAVRSPRSTAQLERCIEGEDEREVGGRHTEMGSRGKAHESVGLDAGDEWAHGRESTESQVARAASKAASRASEKSTKRTSPIESSSEVSARTVSTAMRATSPAAQP